MSFTKHDSEKTRWSLLPLDALEQVCKAFMHGADKYGDGNWEQGAAYNRYWDALERHMVAWQRGEDLDTESGLNHLAHAGACVLILFGMQLRGLGHDNRRKWGPPQPTDELTQEAQDMGMYKDIKLPPMPDKPKQPVVERKVPKYGTGPMVWEGTGDDATD